MSDMSQGPGWWIASDDKWYPPHLHPSVRIDAPTPGNDTLTEPAPDAQEAPAAQASDVPPRFVGPTAFPGPEATLPGPDTTVAESSDLVPTANAPKRRSRTPAAAALSVLVVVLLVAGALVIFGGGKSASAEVIDAVNSTLGDKTAQITLNESIGTANTALTGKGTGAIDFTHETLQLQMTVSADGQEVPIVADYLGSVIYEKVPGLDQITPGKSWISIDLSSLPSTSSPDPTAQGVGDNPSVMLRMLAQQGNKVVALGPSTLDGVDVNGYAVTVTAANVSEELKNAGFPASVRRSLVGSKAQDINLKVFADHSDLLRSFEFQTTQSTGSSGPINVDETIGFSHYGTPVSVPPPPADQVVSFEQFLQAEAALAKPAG